MADTTTTSQREGSSKPVRHGLSRHATPAEIQAHQLSKLLSNPDKPVHVPKAKKGTLEGEFVGSKQLRPPREMMKNVQGSSAGAGSGEFHVYKQSRRREYERLKLMDEEEAFYKQKREAEERQKLAEQVAEEKTLKNRLKRQRKKDARTKHKGGGGGAGQTDSTEGGLNEGGGASTAEREGDSNGGKKRKLAGGGTMKFKTAEEREVEEEEDLNDGDRVGQDEGTSMAQLQAQEEEARRLREEEERAKPAQEAGIKIQDDD